MLQKAQKKIEPELIEYKDSSTSIIHLSDNGRYVLICCNNSENKLPIKVYIYDTATMKSNAINWADKTSRLYDAKITNDGNYLAFSSFYPPNDPKGYQESVGYIETNNPSKINIVDTAYESCTLHCLEIFQDDNFYYCNFGFNKDTGEHTSAWKYDTANKKRTFICETITTRWQETPYYTFINSKFIYLRTDPGDHHYEEIPSILSINQGGKSLIDLPNSYGISFSFCPSGEVFSDEKYIFILKGL